MGNGTDNEERATRERIPDCREGEMALEARRVHAYCQKSETKERGKENVQILSTTAITP